MTASVHTVASQATKQIWDQVEMPMSNRVRNKVGAMGNHQIDNKTRSRIFAEIMFPVWEPIRRLAVSHMVSQIRRTPLGRLP